MRDKTNPKGSSKIYTAQSGLFDFSNMPRWIIKIISNEVAKTGVKPVTRIGPPISIAAKCYCTPELADECLSWLEALSRSVILGDKSDDDCKADE